MKLIYKTENGKLVQGDNIEVMVKLKDNSVDSCISDFPYDLSFMGKKWDTTGDFYEWCKARAVPLHRIIKPGGYVCIFGHPKTNHRMKSAFEDAGFNIVEEIDWVYGTGFPKNQDISKFFDKKAGAEREIVGKNNSKGIRSGQDNMVGDNYECKGYDITSPSTDQAKKWNGWKTAGLKPAHEPITVFQKPLEGTYINNIDTYNVGGMNIDACRIETEDNLNGGAYSGGERGEGEWKENSGFKNDKLKGQYAQPQGRFPANMIFDSFMGDELDGQSGERASGSGNGNAKVGENSNGVITPLRRGTLTPRNDTGGASRFFLNIDAEDFVPFLYCAKATKKEKGEGNTHVTVKPKTLIKWLIKLVTPVDGRTIDITAGSGTHGLSCEELNKNEGYNLHWLNIEMLNTEKDPYCDIAMNRIKAVNE